jgi:hypothetical protein
MLGTGCGYQFRQGIGCLFVYRTKILPETHLKLCRANIPARTVQLQSLLDCQRVRHGNRRFAGQFAPDGTAISAEQTRELSLTAPAALVVERMTYDSQSPSGHRAISHSKFIVVGNERMVPMMLLHEGVRIF